MNFYLYCSSPPPGLNEGLLASDGAERAAPAALAGVGLCAYIPDAAADGAGAGA